MWVQSIIEAPISVNVAKEKYREARAVGGGDNQINIVVDRFNSGFSVEKLLTLCYLVGQTLCNGRAEGDCLKIITGVDNIDMRKLRKLRSITVP